MAVYLGTYVSRVDDGGLEFRETKGTLAIDRARLAFYRERGAARRQACAMEPRLGEGRDRVIRIPD